MRSEQGYAMILEVDALLAVFVILIDEQLNVLPLQPAGGLCLV